MFGQNDDLCRCQIYDAFKDNIWQENQYSDRTRPAAYVDKQLCGCECNLTRSSPSVLLALNS